MTRPSAGKISVAILTPGVTSRPDDVLRTLTVRPSEAIAEVFGVGKPADFPDGMRVVEPDAPGPAGAKTAAIRESRTELALLLAADTLMTPATAERLMADLDRHADCVAVSAWPRREAGWRFAFAWRFPSARRELIPPAWGRRVALPGGAVQTDWVPMGCALVRREAALRVGPWPSGYHFGLEDAVWAWRAKTMGWATRLVGDALAYRLPIRKGGRLSREIRLAYEDSFNRMLEEINGPWSGRHLRARLFRHRLTYAARWLAATLFAGRHSGLNELADDVRWVLDWYAEGRPPAPLAPGAEYLERWDELR